VAHDWGGAVAWHFAHLHPQLINKLIVLDALHPCKINIFNDWNWEQMRKSWYVFFLLLPSIPEIILCLNDFAAIKEAFQSKATGLKNKEQMDDIDIELFKDAAAKPGALTAGINYYRNIPNYLWNMKTLQILQVPVLYLHGEHDAYAKPNSIIGVERFISDLKSVTIPNCSHWSNQDCWQEVNKEIRQFLA